MTIPSSFPMNVPTTIPVLTNVVPREEVFPGTLAALQDRLAEKASFFAMADALKDTMRPELERLVDEVVQRTLISAWAQKMGGLTMSDTSTQ